MILEDFVMLGTTVPETQTRSGRTFVCAGGYSHEMRQFVRIYPLARRHCPSRWSLSKVGLERNPQDSRAESWKIRGDRSLGNHEHINDLFEPAGQIDDRAERTKIMQAMVTASIAEANSRRRSLCIVEPKYPPRLSFQENPNSPDHPQLSMFDREGDVPSGSARFAYQPYLTFHDDDGEHTLQVREWGGYEFMRKFGDQRRHELASNWRLSERPCLFLGNTAAHRNAWLIISVLMPIQQLQLALEDAA